MTKFTANDDLNATSSSEAQVPLSFNEELIVSKPPKISLRTNKAPSYTFTNINAPSLNRESTTLPDTHEQTELTFDETPTIQPINITLPPFEEFEEREVNKTETSIEHNITSVNEAQPADKINSEDNVLKAERVITTPPHNTKSKNNRGTQWTKPEKWTILKSIPSKQRRLVFVLILLLLLLGIFFSLNNHTPTTVEELNNQHGNLPIEYRPVNEEETNTTEKNEWQNVNHIDATQSVSNDANQSKTVVENNNVSQPITTPQLQPIEMPVTAQESVIYQPEVNTNTVNTVEKTVTPAVSPTPKNEKTTLDKTGKKRDKTTKLPPVVDAKPITKNKANPEANKNTTNRKVLVIAKGKTLMQVFRDNHLEIADVNAMTHVNNANNMLGHFKPGDRVEVTLDQNNRVAEMKLDNGSRFIRQSNGSYILKK